MYSIKETIENEIEIKKSIFITDLFRVESEKEVREILNNIKQKHKAATHYCYAYIIDSIKHFSDDGEPGGTAGMPILNALEKNELNYILCIVTRYFGGILLGAGGLVRAYTKSTTEGIKKANIIPLIPSIQCLVEFTYDQIKQIDFLIQDATIIEKMFKEMVTYRFIISKEKWESIKDTLKNNCQSLHIEKDCFL